MFKTLCERLNFEKKFSPCIKMTRDAIAEMKVRKEVDYIACLLSGNCNWCLEVTVRPSSMMDGRRQTKRAGESSANTLACRSRDPSLSGKLHPNYNSPISGGRGKLIPSCIYY